MNDYTRHGVERQERSILGTSDKLYHKLSVMVYKVTLVGLVALFAIGGALGLGAFKGILSSVPDIEGLSVTPFCVTRPFLQASAAIERVLYRRMAKRYLSTLIGISVCFV